MENLCIILARGGSKGLKNKNILPLAGKPVVQYTIEYAQRHKALLTRIILSSDSEQILEVGRKCGIEVDLRPDDLARDSVHIADVIKELYERLQRDSGYKANYITVLYGNVPIRPEDLIERAVDIMRQYNPDIVTTLSPIGKYHPYWLSRLDDSGRVVPYVETTIFRRQDLPPLYIDAGGLLLIKPENLYKTFKKTIYWRFGEVVRAVLVEPWEVIDIDNFLDLKVAEALIKYGGHYGKGLS